MSTDKKNNKLQIRPSKSLTVRDPLNAYMQEVHAYPMLSPEEERELATQFRKFGDIEAAKQLVVSHLRLVAKIAMEYRSASHNPLDLIQEGNVGLLKAVSNFDPDKGARLGHYATWWIRSYILKFILDNFRLIRLGTTKDQKKLFYNLVREKERLEKMGYVATPVELSKQLGVDEKTITDMQKRLSTPEYALEAPVKQGGDDSGSTLQDFISDGSQPVDERMNHEQTHTILQDCFDSFSHTLNERELKIFKERLLSELPLTLQEIADDYGITKERVRQIESRLIQRLKEFFKDSGVEVDSLSVR